MKLEIGFYIVFNFYNKNPPMFKNPFSFEGRIRRLEYGLSYIIYAIVAGGINYFISQISNSGFATGLLIVYIPLLWFLWAQGAKRCHDRGNSGWWQIIPFYVFWLIFADGTPEINEYGPSPKFNSDPDVIGQIGQDLESN